MKAVCFTRNGKPDMRVIHEDIGDTRETVTRQILSDFEGARVGIAAVKEYGDASRWLGERLLSRQGGAA
jgi:hypothetical protein